MTYVSRINTFCMLLCLALASGCTDQSHEYTIRAPEGHAVYKISRPGGIIRDEYFDVALVYGFNDNLVVGQQIVDFLNQGEPNTYFLTRVD